MIAAIKNHRHLNLLAAGLLLIVSMVAVSVTPSKAAAAACSPSSTSSCNASNCSGAGGNWNGAANTCVFGNTDVCSHNNPGGCTSEASCKGSGNNWNPKLDGGLCVAGPDDSGDGNGAAPVVPPAGACNSKPRFLGLVPWYEYLTSVPDTAGGCRITNFDNNQVLGKTSPFLLIALAILDDLVRVAALIAIGFVIAGGFKYITSQGAPEDTKNAQQTIINALVGLVLAILAAGLVSYIGGKLG